MLAKFIKMTAQGNDYIFLDRQDCVSESLESPQIVQRLSSRHFGIGGDGVVFIYCSKVADARMRMYNADGSLGMMCGSALRCVVSIMAQKYEKREYLIETDSGARRGWIDGESGIVKVEMGNIAEFEKIETEGTVYQLKVGNRHRIQITDSIDEIELGEKINSLRYLPGWKDTNFEFVEITGADRIRIIIYERGSGKTLACGTGAVASAYTCHREGFISGECVTVSMPGGDVLVEITSSVAYLSGSVIEVFRGEIEL
jgi:diaminopimelate epimerase